MSQLVCSELYSRRKFDENDFSSKFWVPSSIKASTLLSAFQRSIILEPKSRFPPLDSSPLVHYPIRLTNFLSFEEPSDKFFPTDEWKMPKGSHIHIKTLASNTIVSPMVKGFKEWGERSNLIGTCLCGAKLEAMVDFLLKFSGPNRSMNQDCNLS